MRLDKFLADAGIGTRSEVKKIIQKRNISVNGNRITDPGFKVTDTDVVMYDQKVVSMKQNVYYMFHKPAGCVSATTDREKTVLDYFDDKTHDLFPVGRLDKDTEGLLIITDDGAFAHEITSPKKHIAKNYYFEAEGKLDTNAKQLVQEGIDIGDDTLTLPGQLLIHDQNDNIVKGNLIIYEGRFHQVKRMISKLGAKVIYLKRISIGELTLDNELPPGSYRMLTIDELNSIKTC